MNDVYIAFRSGFELGREAYRKKWSDERREAERAKLLDRLMNKKERKTKNGDELFSPGGDEDAD